MYGQGFHDKFSSDDAIAKGELYLKYDKPAGTIVAAPDFMHGHGSMLALFDAYGETVTDGWVDDLVCMKAVAGDGSKSLMHAARGEGPKRVGG